MKSSVKFFFFLTILVGTQGALKAQDPVFSQFFAAPLQLNPAFTGTSFAPRITFNYRNQYANWLGGSAYSTYAVAYEQPVENLNSGLGLMLIGDSAGQGIYKTNRASAFYSYQVRMDDDFAVKFGVQAGLIQTRINWERLLFGDQIDPVNGPVGPDGSVDPTAEERPDQLTRTSFDVSAGMLVYKGAFYGGLSLKHLSTPDESILAINQNLSAGLPLRTTVHAGAEIPLLRGNNLSNPAFISPNLMFVKQGEFGQIDAGAYAGFGKIFAGSWYRHTFSNPDAVIVMVGYREGVLRIGYSYDQTISRLAAAPGGTGGTHEISITINFEDSYDLKRKRRSARYNDCFNMFR